ncbi:hypothetical protein CW751_09535 [Brumimicrobium salinarum]|uniref:Uncharacterized protein n=1 Tax=Brumimicrobium salinarum TaxID=2058658 RepID=A0A2I0R216_9FLAO|nr:hypothetical protein [Brumimicrobium salinarum]PKR80605.1 hypothetical protein CW751_09535 [Brumimicrobium salinarum]
MNKIVGILLTILLLISCKNSQKMETENKSESKNELTQTELIKSESNQTELIVQKILDLPKLQWIFHPELKERLPVKVLETEMIEKNFNLKKFGQKVRILSKSELENEGIKDFVIIDKIKIEKDTAEFGLSYKIEGAGCSGKFFKQNGEWKIRDYSVWEN